MTLVLQSRRRQVVPRWRDFRTTVQLGELAIPSTSESISRGSDLAQAIADWEAHRTTAFAGDLICASIVSGNLTAARDASEFVLSLEDGASAQLTALAKQVLNRNVADPLPTLRPIAVTPDGGPKRSLEIAGARKRLVRYPTDAVLWMDLAYLYALRGLLEKAERCVRIALNLAPANRFILRSGARFFIHRGAPDLGHDVIRRAPNLRSDPWLVGAEIATAQEANIAPRMAKTGFSLLSSGQFDSSHLTELGSALGTLECHEGNQRKAKRLIRGSLLGANENSLAQAEYLARVQRLRIGRVDPPALIVRPFEAETYARFWQTSWDKALESALLWLKDQPFSTRPIQMACYIAETILEDFELGGKIATLGLLANPDSSALRIGRAYVFSKRGQTEEARRELARVHNLSEQEWIETAIHANHGLIAFREGFPDAGRRYYAEALRKSDGLGNKKTQFAVLMNWIQEELRFDDGTVEPLLERARESARTVSDPEMPFLLERLERRVAKKRETRDLPLG